MTNPDLAALSVAATQGEWRTDCAEHDMPYQDIRIKSGKRTITTIYLDDAPVRDFNDAQNANAKLITALVNEYRAGNLVQIDEGMRERAETCLRNIEKRATVQPDEIGNAKQLEINCYTILAHLADLRAVIAAMGGAK